jgi:GMP synthase-like glutamine amidotransferase
VTAVATTRIGLLIMDELPEVAQPVRGDYPDLYRHLLRRDGVEFIDVLVHRGDAPASLDDCDGWLVGGSRYSVDDDLDWIRTAENVVRDAVAAERPIVGICFGHQLMAQALGGRTSKVGWGVGVRRYETVEPVPWSPGTDDAMSLLACHEDQVVETPPDATVWSTSDYCPIAGMTIGERAWSVQAHPEFTPDVCDVIYESRRAVIGDDEVDAAKRSFATPVSNAVIADAIVSFIRG